MKTLIALSLALISTSAFAVGDPVQVIPLDQLKSEVASYQVVIAGTKCQGLVPLTGATGGGSAGIYDVQYEYIQLAPDENSDAVAQLTISRTTYNTQPKSVVSFECIKFN